MLLFTPEKLIPAVIKKTKSTPAKRRAKLSSKE